MNNQIKIPYKLTGTVDEPILVAVLSNRPVMVRGSDSFYQPFLEGLKTGASESELLALVEEERQKFEAALDLSDGFERIDGVVTYQGAPLSHLEQDYVVNLHRQGYPLDTMARYCDSLLRNPYERSKQQLYGFLDYGRSALHPSGGCVVYKRVRENWFDVHSGQVLNKPAALLTQEERDSLPRKVGNVTVSLDSEGRTVVSMPGWAVDADPERTCSHGLHVCSYDYLACFGGSRVIAVLVMPEDVVSVPTDYRHTKMRVRKYTILEELPELKRDELGTGGGYVEPNSYPFGLYREGYGPEEGDEPEDSFSSLSDAMDAARELAGKLGEDIDVWNMDEEMKLRTVYFDRDSEPTSTYDVVVVPQHNATRDVRMGGIGEEADAVAAWRKVILDVMNAGDDHASRKTPEAISKVLLIKRDIASGDEETIRIVDLS